MIKRSLTWVIFAVWLLTAGAGFAVLLKYQDTAGVAHHSPARWPVSAPIIRDGLQPTLVMFLHPKCPCSRASLEELSRALTQAKDRAAIHLIFLHPAGFDESWVHGNLWNAAQNIPGVQLHEDVDGKMARLFAAETSGYVLLYDTSDQLVFQGGITESRGHAGDNTGKASLVALLNGLSAPIRETRVYGCSLTGHCETPMILGNNDKR